VFTFEFGLGMKLSLPGGYLKHRVMVSAVSGWCGQGDSPGLERAEKVFYRL